jgi:diguanylate cyclase (GGDEF)-like protein
MSDRAATGSEAGVRTHAFADLPTREVITAALMAGFYLVANGLAFAWALASDDPHMLRGTVLVLIGISTALFPALMWGMFKLPRLAFQLIIAATSFLVAGAIYASGQADTPLAFLFLWGVPYTLAFFTPRQAVVQIALVILASGGAYLGVQWRIHGNVQLTLDESLRWAFVAATEIALAALVLRMRSALRASGRRLRQRASQQATVSEIGQRALSDVALTPLLNETMAMVAETMSISLVTVLELLPKEEMLLIRAGYGWPPGIVGEHRFPFDDQSQAAMAIRAEAPVVVEDYSREIRFRGAAILHAQGARSGISVPIRGRGGAFGVLAAHHKDLRGFSSDDVNFLQSVANVLAAAIERRRSEAETRHQALHDPLTGLPNRTLFKDRLQHALARNRRSGGTLAVLFLDIDNFKVVNDSLGHEAGDGLLCALAPRLAECVRSGDTVARFGGDEFVLLCEDISDEQEALEIAERVKQCFARPVPIAGGEHFVTASIGVAMPTAGHDSPDSLLRDADAAMYQAKQRGRARFELFDSAMRATAVKRLQTEAELRRAIERDELRLVFQPVIDLESARMAAVEALVRWEHPEREDTVSVAETLHELQALGVKLVLDDFGTGYSSLGYVKRFPLSFLKLDRSFVAELGKSHRDAAIISAIVDLSRALEARVVAEGVETEDQLRRVRALGCDLAQGFLFARPLPADEIDGLLRSDPWRIGATADSHG